MHLYLQTLLFTGNIVAPIFFILFLGFFLLRLRVINENFVNTASKLVFTLTLPALVFLAIARMDFHAMFNPDLLGYVIIATLITYALIWWLGSRWIGHPEDLAAFVQGAFRSNYGIIGLAVSYNLFGQSGLAQASLLLALIIPLYNVLAILCLTLPLKRAGGVKPGRIALEVVRNPLILAVVLALPFSYFNIGLPALIARTGDYFADLTLPLALLAIGGSLNLKSLRDSSGTAFWATLIKLVLLPALLTPLAWLAGFRSEELVILMVLFASPTAAASFVMAKAMGANAELSANVILTTTLGSVVTLSCAIYLVKLLGVI
ncbi:AEC family transporter [Marinobacterium sp. D7]|uniref:AEC family transporter n=1 Tax=Marinobacterium ramblicola TaxID=2849041 RepID=UPI001C2D311A|nr:AEC family transporter [Marinobacterium ramblicola]